MLPNAPASRRTPARKVRTTDGATAYLPAIELRDAVAASPFWCDCHRRVEAGSAHIVARRVGDADGVFDVRWCSIACRSSRLGGAA